MIKKKIADHIYGVIKKLVNKLYSVGVFEILTKQNKKPEITAVVKGDNCYIDSSAVLITNETGKIILKGSNYIGRNTELQPSNNCLIKIGVGTSIQDRNIILGDVEFGRYCLTAPNVYISSGRHYFDLDPNFYIKDQDQIVLNSEELSKKHSRKIVIEDDVWIGINSVIMPGIIIGRGSVIGSNSVVTQNVAPFSIMVGAPARLIRYRLNFVPKSVLTFNEDNDLPNFYKGFFVNLQNLIEDRKSGGISAGHRFTVYMADKGLKIQLAIKSFKDNSFSLVYNNQEHTVSGPAFVNLSFNLENTNYHVFEINSPTFDENEKIFLIKEIIILN